ncbi:phosphopantetheine-binding protein [Streptomyces marokkonensis]|uniref:Phosphopantetheine-binding protein n=1 Tax=Streptomyces marokkonensis TaxID=324855 RepID=A0ABW6QGB1_9ACTN
MRAAAVVGRLDLGGQSGQADPFGERDQPKQSRVRDQSRLVEERRDMDSGMGGSFVTLPGLPLTANGKVDSGRLPAPQAPAGWSAGRTPPRTGPERAIHAVWADVLDRADIVIDDDFFDLGGHSMLAVRLSSRLRTGGCSDSTAQSPVDSGAARSRPPTKPTGLSLLFAGCVPAVDRVALEGSTLSGTVRRHRKAMTTIAQSSQGSMSHAFSPGEPTVQHLVTSAESDPLAGATHGAWVAPEPGTGAPL